MMQKMIIPIEIIILVTWGSFSSVGSSSAAARALASAAAIIRFATPAMMVNMTASPKRMKKTETKRESSCTGETSPYPTVVIVVVRK